VPGVTRVEAFDPGSTDPYRLRLVAGTEPLAFGRAYWIHTTAGGIWVQG
jgi:hypothetical protein